MFGKIIRYNKLFSGGKPPVVVAVDHGQTFGPIEGLIDFKKSTEKLSEADGVLLAPAMVKHTGNLFTKKNSPLMILRLNWTSGLCIPWEYKDSATIQVMSPAEAMSLGADVVLANLTLQTGDESRDANNVRVFAEIAKEKDKAGIPLVGEVIPVFGQENKEKFHRYIKELCRIACELGADMIKTYYTGPKFNEVTSGVPIPVFALGAEKLPNEIDALKLAKNAMDSGAGGVVFGRNVIQSKNPDKFLLALKDVVKNNVPPEDALAKYL